MALIPFAVLWLAYQCGWYGFCTIKPICGVGFTDLILPNKMAKVDGLIQNPQACDSSQNPLNNVPPGSDKCVGNTCVGGGQIFGGGTTPNTTAPNNQSQPAQLIPNAPAGDANTGTGAIFV